MTAPATPAPRRRRRWPFYLLALLLVLGGAHAAALFWLSGQIQAGLEGWAAQRRAQGWQVEYGTPSRAGWPLAASLRVPALRLASGPLEWRAEAVTLSLFPPDIENLHWKVEGAQQLVLDGPPMPLRAASLEGELRLDGQAPPRAGSLRAEQITLESPLGPVALPVLQASFQAPPGQPLGLQARLRGLTLPDRLAPPSPAFGPRIEDMTLDASLSGPLDLPGALPQRLAQWRDAGGRLEIRGMTLRWGPAAASAAASLGLDAALQPSGSGTVRLANPGATVDALVASGAIPARNAGTIRRILPLLTRLEPGGGSPVIELPVAVENQTLSVARFPVMQVQTMDWR